MRRPDPFRWNKDDKLFPLLEEALLEATQRGYSVIELSRYLGNSASRNLYGIMRDAGIIPKLPRGRGPKVDVHPALLSALEKCQISFHQWVNSHDLEPVATAHALKAELDFNDPVSVAAHKALKQDFRFLSPKMYKLPVDPDLASSAGPNCTLTDYTITIEPDKQNNGYRAYIHELTECSCLGATRDEAFFGLKSRYVLFHSVRKLRVLPDKRTQI